MLAIRLISQRCAISKGVDDGFSLSEKYGSNGSIVKKNDFITKNFFINGMWYSLIDHSVCVTNAYAVQATMAFGRLITTTGANTSTTHKI